MTSFTGFIGHLAYAAVLPYERLSLQLQRSSIFARCINLFNYKKAQLLYGTAEIARVSGHYAVQGHSRSLIFIIAFNLILICLQLVPKFKLVLLNELERRNGRYLALFYRIRYSFGPDYVTEVEDRPMSQNLVFSNI